MEAEQHLREQLVNQTYDQVCRRSRKLVGRAIVARVERRFLHSFEGGLAGAINTNLRSHSGANC